MSFLGFHADRPRYTYLGLIRPEYRSQPDYNPSNTLEKIMISATRRIVQYEKKMWDYCALDRDRAFKLASPSWVPDWFCLPSATYFLTSHNHLGLDASFSEDETVLELVLHIQALWRGVTSDTPKPSLKGCLSHL